MMYTSYEDDDQDYSNYRLKKILLIAAAALVLIVAIGAAVFLLVSNRGLTFSIEFTDVKGLAKNSQVLLHGVPIGKVEKIAINGSGMAVVSVKIDAAYQSQIHNKNIYRIVEGAQAASGLPSYTVDVEVADPNEPVIREGAIQHGSSSELEATVDRIQSSGQSELQKNLRLGSLDMRTTIYPERISRRFVLESGLLIPQTVLFAALLPTNDGWKQAQTENEQGKQITVEGTFAKASLAQWNYSQTDLKVDEWFLWTDYTYTEVFKKVGLEELKSLYEL